MSKSTPALPAGFFMPGGHVPDHKPLDDDVAELLEVCRDCCVKHPKLARDTHSGMYFEAGKDKVEESPAVKKAKRRNDRKRSRFERALAGEYTPVRRSAA
jgi:hypothetical protein